MSDHETSDNNIYKKPKFIDVDSDNQQKFLRSDNAKDQQNDFEQLKFKTMAVKNTNENNRKIQNKIENQLGQLHDIDAMLKKKEEKIIQKVDNQDINADNQEQNLDNQEENVDNLPKKKAIYVTEANDDNQKEAQKSVKQSSNNFKQSSNYYPAASQSVQFNKQSIQDQNKSLIGQKADLQEVDQNLDNQDKDLNIQQNVMENPEQKNMQDQNMAKQSIQQNIEKLAANQNINQTTNQNQRTKQNIAGQVPKNVFAQTQIGSKQVRMNDDDQSLDQQQKPLKGIAQSQKVVKTDRKLIENASSSELQNQQSYQNIQMNKQSVKGQNKSMIGQKADLQEVDQNLDNQDKDLNIQQNVMENPEQKNMQDQNMAKQSIQQNIEKPAANQNINQTTNQNQRTKQNIAGQVPKNVFAQTQIGSKQVRMNDDDQSFDQQQNPLKGIAQSQKVVKTDRKLIENASSSELQNQQSYQNIQMNKQSIKGQNKSMIGQKADLQEVDQNLDNQDKDLNIQQNVMENPEQENMQDQNMAKQSIQQNIEKPAANQNINQTTNQNQRTKQNIAGQVPKNVFAQTQIGSKQVRMNDDDQSFDQQQNPLKGIAQSQKVDRKPKEDILSSEQQLSQHQETNFNKRVNLTNTFQQDQSADNGIDQVAEVQQQDNTEQYQIQPNTQNDANLYSENQIENQEQPARQQIEINNEQQPNADDQSPNQNIISQQLNSVRPQDPELLQYQQTQNNENSNAQHQVTQQQSNKQNSGKNPNENLNNSQNEVQKQLLQDLQLRTSVKHNIEDINRMDNNYQQSVEKQPIDNKQESVKLTSVSQQQIQPSQQQNANSQVTKMSLQKITPKTASAMKLQKTGQAMGRLKAFNASQFMLKQSGAQDTAQTMPQPQLNANKPAQDSSMDPNSTKTPAKQLKQIDQSSLATGNKLDTTGTSLLSTSRVVSNIPNNSLYAFYLELIHEFKPNIEQMIQIINLFAKLQKQTKNEQIQQQIQQIIKQKDQNNRNIALFSEFKNLVPQDINLLMSTELIKSIALKDVPIRSVELLSNFVDSLDNDFVSQDDLFMILVTVLGSNENNSTYQQLNELSMQTLTDLKCIDGLLPKSQLILYLSSLNLDEQSIESDTAELQNMIKRYPTFKQDCLQTITCIDATRLLQHDIYALRFNAQQDQQLMDAICNAININDQTKIKLKSQLNQLFAKREQRFAEYIQELDLTSNRKGQKEQLKEKRDQFDKQQWLMGTNIDELILNADWEIVDITGQSNPKQQNTTKMQNTQYQQVQNTKEEEDSELSYNGQLSVFTNATLQSNVATTKTNMKQVITHKDDDVMKKLKKALTGFK